VQPAHVKPRTRLAAIVLATAAGMCALGADAPAPTSAAGDEEVVHLAEVRVEDVIERLERDGRSAGSGFVPFYKGTATTGSLPTLKSALSALPGLIVQDSFGGFDPPRISARGSGLQSAPVSRGLLWTLDGLPLNGADGSFNSALFDPGIAEGARLLPGATDPLAAGIALGGTLALETPFTGAYPRAAFALGEHGYARGAFLKGRDLGDSTVWLAGTLTRTDGWREQSAQRRAVMAGCFNHHFGPQAPMLFVRVYGANPRFDVPGPLTLAAATAAPSSVSALTVADRPRRETDFGRAALELQWDKGELRRFSLEFAAQTTRDWFRQLRANGISETDGDDFTARASLRRDVGEHTVYAGIGNLWGGRTQSRFVNLSGAEGTRFAALDLEARTTNAWFEDRWKLDDVTVLTSAISLASVAREASGPAAASGRVRDDALAARIALRRQVGDNTWLTAAVSRSAEAPTFDDLLSVRGTAPNLSLGWTPLRIQRSDTLEFGMRRTWKNATLEVTGYTSNWSDELLRLADASGAARGTVNAGPTRHRGVETALRWQLRDGARPLALALTHTWSEARFTGNAVYGRNRLAGLPPHAGSVFLATLPDEGWFGVLGATWIGGRTFADHANRLGYDGNFLVNARVGWTAKHWTVALELNNAFDRAHIASTAGVIDIARTGAPPALFLPGAPRTLGAALEWRW
jgi:iron complex outermembrane recepter protein